MDQYFSIATVTNRIREKLIKDEGNAIGSNGSAITPYGSKPQGIHGGSEYQTIFKDKTLQYRDSNNRPYYSVMDAREMGDEDEWGKIQPRFYQVGAKDIGKPFLIADALLVTGANAETNEFLYSELALKDMRSLVSNYTKVLSEYATHGPPAGWVNAPLVYVDAKHVQGM